MLHDPALYPEPDVFKLEQFLNKDGSLRDDPNLTSVFGFGRQICPRRHFVSLVLFIVVTSIFSTFNVKSGEDGGAARGNLSDYTFTGGSSR